MRERASALLQIASSKSGRWVAAHGLLKKGRDRKLSFFSQPIAQAKTKVLLTIRQSPFNFGLNRSRWQLNLHFGVLS